MKKILRVALTALVLATGAQAAYPDKPVTNIVPFPPGGSTDMLARFMTQKMAEKLGQPVIVENKPGATGAIGATQVKRAAPDGYTLLTASIGVWAVNPFLQKNLAYDPAKDFDLLTVAVRAPNILVTNPNVPAKSVAELSPTSSRNRAKSRSPRRAPVLLITCRSRCSGNRPAPPASTSRTRAAVRRFPTWSPATPKSRSRTSTR